VQCAEVNLAVKFSRNGTTMTKHFTDLGERRSSLEHVGSQRMAQQMGPFVWGMKSGSVNGLPDNGGDVRGGDKSPMRRVQPHKNMAGQRTGAAMP
jgi:hypothetical protein